MKITVKNLRKNMFNLREVKNNKPNNHQTNHKMSIQFCNQMVTFFLPTLT